MPVSALPGENVEHEAAMTLFPMQTNKAVMAGEMRQHTNDMGWNESVQNDYIPEQQYTNTQQQYSQPSVADPYIQLPSLQYDQPVWTEPHLAGPQPFQQQELLQQYVFTQLSNPDTHEMTNY